MSMPSDPSLLDNAFWHALTGRQAHLAIRHGNGAAYAPEVSPFCATADFSDESWADLAELAAERRFVVLLIDPSFSPPAGWRQVMNEIGTQFVAADLDDVPDIEFVELGNDDAAEMVALAKATEPGPFSLRTLEMGRYVGVRRGGRLVAMAGERLSCDGWTEVSAVCVDPSARRSGLGAACTLEIARTIRERGDEAVLHVREGNEPALALYERIGFAVRTHMTIGAWVIDV